MDAVTTGRDISAFLSHLTQGAERRTTRFASARRRAWMLATALLLLSSTSLPVPAQTHPTEFQVKAAYLYNFGKFVRWPAASTPNVNSFEICVLGKDPFAAVLETTVTGESIDRKTIAVKRISNLQESNECSILFIGSSEENRLKAILAATHHLSILTVSDIPRFAERGGVIGFVVQEDKIRFEVNLGAAEQAHLALSSELLKVASHVIAKPVPQS
jgi:hypothetical protein